MSNAYREMFLFVRNYRNRNNFSSICALRLFLALRNYGNRNNLKMMPPLYSDMLYFINFELEVDE